MKTKTKHRGQNKVRGRVTGVEVGEHIYTFEQTRLVFDPVKAKSVGWVRFRRRGSRKVTAVEFEWLVANAAGLRRKVGDKEYAFQLTAEGLSVGFAGSRQRQVTPWEVLVNLSRKQPVLFEEAA